MFLQVFEAAFLGISALLILSVAFMMYRNGRLVLLDAFYGNQQLANSVNRSLTLGFCLMMAGDVAVLDQTYLGLFDYWQVYHLVVDKIGSELILVGLLYFVNIFILSRIRPSAQIRLKHARFGESELA